MGNGLGKGTEAWRCELGISRPVLLKKNVNLGVMRSATGKVGVKGLLCYVQELALWTREMY